jgi:hypothetical protein
MLRRKLSFEKGKRDFPYIPIIDYQDGSWGFWNEVWCDRYDGYESFEKAYCGLCLYCIRYLLMDIPFTVA